ncbi:MULTISPECIES: hypothetical protein [unclassified Snodgrassella]|uniref:hypothetical protein n=1 Tax=unclassified Snodgrassella TaxID=2625236 RepID=UPI0018DDA73F|nr:MULTISPECIES: hypothetical protein [unclassified Snodgrassella]MBI0158351.1 hypothetical protein [Snodgrassella sp. W6238H11]MBI0161062.1 hypothetical protein [Snodgrassella sp. W6238H14]
MAFYENQSDMFKKRAENNKKQGDQYYAMAMKAKDEGNSKEYGKYFVQSQTQYKMQKENELKAKEHAGKSW